MINTMHTQKLKADWFFYSCSAIYRVITMRAISVALTNCEVRNAITFLLAKGLPVTQSHLELCLVYEPTVMSQGKVTQCSELKYRPTKYEFQQLTIVLHIHFTEFIVTVTYIR